MGVNQLTGTPWHEERFHRADGDPKRNRARCRFYLYQDGGHCLKRGGECMGSAHCPVYKAVTDQEFEERQKARKKNLPYPDNDPFLRASSRTKEPLQMRTLRKAGKRKPGKEETPQDAAIPIVPGSKVEHKVYGLGEVKSVSNGRIVVTFTEKEVSFEFPKALENGFLKVRSGPKYEGREWK